MFKQRRTYADFVNSGCGNTFAEYMGIVAPHYEFIHGGIRMVRWAEYGRATVHGEVKPTKKEAKESYKKALAKHHLYIAQVRFDAECS